jgi:hypothetical protein
MQHPSTVELRSPRAGWLFDDDGLYQVNGVVKARDTTPILPGGNGLRDVMTVIRSDNV